ncbi:hypothetical protein Tco_1518464, partial [Tanacetum coccineum]
SSMARGNRQMRLNISSTYDRESRSTKNLLDVVGREHGLIKCSGGKERDATLKQALKEFLHSAKGEVRSLASLYSDVVCLRLKWILFFGEDPVH